MKLELVKSSFELTAADLVVVFACKSNAKSKVSAPDKRASGKKAKNSHSEVIAEVLIDGLGKSANLLVNEKVHAAIKGGSLTGAACEFVLFRDAKIGQSQNLAVVGLGDKNDVNSEVIRQAFASAFNGGKAAKVKSMAFMMDSLETQSLAPETVMQAAAEGAALASYSFYEFKTGKKDEGLASVHFVSSSKHKGQEKGLESAMILAECVNFARWLGDRPGNRMTPSILAEEASKAAKGTKLKVTVWDRTKIKAKKMHSFLSVSLGSSQEPKFIIMEYKGAAASKKPVCFVGKGLTFDSGGISIKPSAGMEEMKYDMCGGANVIGTMLAIAKLGLKINAIGLVPATENMPGPGANKPGDIVIARNGKSIEVNNTDAEGRLILNDALVYACEQNPAAIFDAATLTGAMVVALGNIHTGFFTRNDKLAAKVEAAASTTGELVWRMPLTDFHAKDMKGTYADLSNISSGKGAGSATAAAFLESFVEKDIPWAHFDIAGTGWHNGDRFPYNPRKGASGTMIRTFVELAKGF
jgi:leucyl aminopeptidase